MKKADQYLEDFITEPNFEQIEELIKQAQIDAIEETCRVCAEEVANLSDEDTYVFGTCEDEDRIYSYDLNGLRISNDKILSVADKLKKEL